MNADADRNVAPRPDRASQRPPRTARLARWVAPLLTRSALASAIPVVVALLLSGAISFSYNRLLKEYRDAVDHTFMVLSAIDTALLRLQDAETGQRGFIITGNDSYLAPFQAGQSDIPKVLTDLGDLVADNPTHQPQIATLRQLTETKLRELQDTIAIRRADGFEPARAMIVGNSGKETMDRIREVAAQMRATERQLFDLRVASARRAERLMIGVAVICVALSLFGRMLAAMMRSRIEPS